MRDFEKPTNLKKKAKKIGFQAQSGGWPLLQVHNSKKTCWISQVSHLLQDQTWLTFAYESMKPMAAIMYINSSNIRLSY